MMYDLIVIGGGPAGLAAAFSAYKEDVLKILIIERDRELGGILNQCIHNGFGLHYFKEELTGPEYAGRFIRMLRDTPIEISLDTMALELTADRKLHVVSKSGGYRILKAKSVIIATGCRERAGGALSIPGTRPSGIFTAGTAQRYMNMEGFSVGKRAVILGSGDIGLIMARRMTLEGAKVLACIELMPYSGGLTRNIVQCLEDYGIPLYLSHTITEIRGKNRVEGVVVSEVDENRKPVEGSEIVFDCDTVLLSVGLIPENELAKQAGIAIDKRTGGAVVFENMQTSVEGVFACGNAAHVHDLVDFVTAESVRAGKAAADYVKNGAKAATDADTVMIRAGGGISYTVPQKIRREVSDKSVDIFFRVNRIFGKSKIIVSSDDKELLSFSRGHFAPGEMERISLPREIFESAGSEIDLQIEEDCVQ